MDGTPMLNDISVLIAETVMHAVNGTEPEPEEEFPAFLHFEECPWVSRLRCGRNEEVLICTCEITKTIPWWKRLFS